MDKPNHIYLHIKTRYFASTKFDKPSYIYIYKIFLEEQRGEEKSFQLQKGGEKQRERERFEKIELIFGIISICRNEGSLSPPQKKRKRKKRKRWYPFDRVSPRNAKPCPLYKYNN